MTIGPETPKAQPAEVTDPKLAIANIKNQVEAGHVQRIDTAAREEVTVEEDTHAKLADLMKNLPKGITPPEQRNAA
jgi:hypothetical protein